MARQLTLYPPFQQRGWTHLHDPLAVATVVDPGLVTLQPLRLDVELESRLAPGATLARLPTEALPANAAVALEVDAPRFEAMFLERACRPLPARRAGSTPPPRPPPGRHDLSSPPRAGPDRHTHARTRTRRAHR